MEQYQQALKCRPNYAEAHYNLGLALASRGQLDEAIEHYQQALRLRPNFAKARNNLNKALAQARAGPPSTTSAPNSPAPP